PDIDDPGSCRKHFRAAALRRPCAWASTPRTLADRWFSAEVRASEGAIPKPAPTARLTKVALEDTMAAGLPGEASGSALVHAGRRRPANGAQCAPRPSSRQIDKGEAT